MTDTLWADVSKFQAHDPDETYPYRVLAIRSNDGTYRDETFASKYAAARRLIAAGHLDVLIVYFVYRTNWHDCVATHKAMIGQPIPQLVSMIDVESWGGQIRGDQSVGINAAREMLISWYGGNRKRVIGYGNVGDLTTLWRTRGDVRLVVAGYGTNPSFPGKLAHQFADNYPVKPFGRCDINSADGYSVAALKVALGLSKPTPGPTPDPKPSTPYYDTTHYRSALVARNGAFAVFLEDDGRLELRHNGQLVGYYTRSGA